MLIKRTHRPQSIQEYLYRHPQPNLSIKIQQVQEKTKHTFICECEMCRQYDGKKIVEILKQKTEIVNRKIKEKVQNSKIPSEYFLQILKKLVLPHHKIVKRGIDIYVPEICFFKDGQSKGIFMNRQLDDFSIKKIHKNAVNPGLIAKLFNQRRRAYKQDIKKALGLSDRRPLTQQKSTSPLKGRKQLSGIQQKDAVLIKHTDGFESMMTQSQFIMLTLRRKQDPIWKTIQVIKNIINVHDELKNVFFVKYEKTNIKYDALLQRTKILTRIYSQNIIEGQADYVSAEEQNNFCLQMLKTNRSCFADYVVYKIVSFIQFFYDEQIFKLSCKILVNQINKPYLIDVTSYKKKTLIKYTWTNDTYKKKVLEQEKKMFIDKAINVTEELQQKASKIKQLMEHKYHEMKNKYGITMEQSDNEEESKNNEFFKKIHPQFNGLNLSEVIMADRNISITDFRKKYLGFKEKKKPLVKQFGTHMLQILHRTTPKLKVADFHDISFRPNQSGYFSSRKSSNSQIKKGSSFSVLAFSLKQSCRPTSVQSSNKSRKKQKSRAQLSSRAPTSASYRRSGCHLHVSPNSDTYVKNVLNLHK